MNEAAATRDPANELLWRQSLVRLEAESLRDAALAVSGSLNLSMGGRGFFPRLPPEVVAGQSRPGLGWEISSAADALRRSVYVFSKRTMRLPLLEAFDAGNTDSPTGLRSVTTVAPQALMLLNSDLVRETAARLAARIRERAQGDAERTVEEGYALALQRAPSAKERTIALEFLASQRRAARARPLTLDFKTATPAALSTEYLGRLAPADFVSSPRREWIGARGSWGDRTEGIWWAEPERGPFALWNGGEFADAVLSGECLLQKGCEQAGILLRATTRGTTAHGCELRIDAQRGVVTLVRHGDEAHELARTAFAWPADFWIPFRFEVMGDKVRASVGGAQTIEATDANPPVGAGRVGARAWGAAMSLKGLTLTAGGVERRILPDEELPGAPTAGERAAREATEAFAHLLLNLNEFLYCD